MKESIENMKNHAIMCGVTRASIIDTSKIVFDETLVFNCQLNSCGHYGTNWMCPPGVGKYEDLVAKVMAFKTGLLYQYVYKLEDSFDFEGMVEGRNKYNEVSKKLYEIFDVHYKEYEILRLSGGACSLCEKCSYVDNEPCRFKELAVSSVEAHGMDVNRTLTNYDMPYNNGVATVSYVGLILFK